MLRTCTRAEALHTGLLRACPEVDTGEDDDAEYTKYSKIHHLRVSKSRFQPDAKCKEEHADQ